MAILTASPAALADWPESTSLGSGDIAFGAAIRNWGPTDEVFIVAELRDDSAGENLAALWWYTCSDNDGCATATVEASDGVVGDPIGYNNLTHPSLGVRRDDNTSPVELKIVLRQKLQADCNGNGSTTDGADQSALDLLAVDWDNVSGWGASLPVYIDGYGGSCVDHGLSETRFFSGDAYTCATQIVGSPGNDQLYCNEDTNATWRWVDDLVLSNGTGSDFEDHPSFDLKSGGERVVAGHLGTSGTDAVRVHWPDDTAPPNEPIVSFVATGGDRANHPNLIVDDGAYYMVWEDNAGASAQIRYGTCDPAFLGDCEDVGDWTITSVTSGTAYTRDAKFAQIARDGENEFVVYQYDSDAGSGTKLRVMVASRCVGGAWSIEQVRTPGVAANDQIVEVGRPSIVLNRQEGIAHVAFAEVDEYESDNNFSTIGDGTVWWYRKEYTACP